MKYSLKQVKNSYLEIDPIVSKLIFHPIGKYLVFLLANFTSITPNQVTVFSFILRIGAAYAILTQNFIISAVLAALSHLFDGIDGVLARVTEKKSKLGGLLDSLFDGIGYSLLILSLAVMLLMKGRFDSALIILVLFYLFFNEYNSNLLFNKNVNKEEVREKSALHEWMEKLNNSALPVFFKRRISKIVALTLKIKMNPIPSFIETYFLLFVVAPFFNYNNIILVVAILLYLPQFIFSLIKLFFIMKKLKSIG